MKKINALKSIMQTKYYMNSCYWCFRRAYRSLFQLKLKSTSCIFKAAYCAKFHISNLKGLNKKEFEELEFKFDASAVPTDRCFN